MAVWHERDATTGKILCGSQFGTWTSMLTLVNCEACMTIKERRRKVAQDFADISNALLDDVPWITNMRLIERLES